MSESASEDSDVVESVETIRFEDLSISGTSRAGIETWFRVRPPDAAFDVGRGSPRLAGVDRVFLTHGHLDHVAGVPLLLSQRSLAEAGPTRIYCPERIREPLDRYVRAAADLENRCYEYELVPLDPGDRVAVGADLFVEAFAAEHVVPALGYHLIRVVERLEGRYAGESGDRIAALRKAGEPVTRREERLLLSYPGDTAAAVFESVPSLFRSEVLLLECTFLEERWLGSAADFGHIHLQDLVCRESKFSNRRIVLHHLSRRFSPRELRRGVEEQLPRLASRIRILGESAADDD